MIKVLGIESSCDETSVAIVADNKNIIDFGIMFSLLKRQKIFNKTGG